MEGHVANSAEEATSIASDMGVPVAIKSQVLVGGRGKAGGIKFADNLVKHIKLLIHWLVLQLMAKEYISF